jgi:hypothetical protein
MTSTDSEQISDEALASRISDDGRLSSDAFSGDEDGIVEAGIPPETNGSSAEEELNEEAFSVDDFDSDMSIAEVSNPKEDTSGMDAVTENTVIDDSLHPETNSTPIVKQEETIPAGQVTEFRQTLSALSRQLEIDRLTFLYQQLQSRGNELPSLDSIASDIKGEASLHPMGDQDLYSKRPLARLQGWISGLSFGVGRRAKKFSR